MPPLSPTIALNDARAMPRLGLGAWAIDDADAPAIVRVALESGYRAVDTAAAYGNERGVGAGVRAASVPRADVFITTKLWNDGHGFDAARAAFDASLKRLGLDAVDLYLIHWPAPARGLIAETWRALVDLRAQGRARSIGVSNFRIEDLERIVGETGVTPAVNQIELHPRFQQRALRAFHDAHDIRTESWSPLGRGALLSDATITAIARRRARTPAQIILRWHMQHDLIAIPKSAHPGRIAENIALWDFELDKDDLAAIAALDSPRGRIGPDPARFS